MPRVSVLMTVYNAADYLAIAIDSVLAQSFTNWELVIVDDGSTDASAALVAAYGDPRIAFTRLPANVGRTPALRLAFAAARGELLAVLDADDVAHPARLERQVEFLDRHPDVVLVGTWASYIDATGREFARWTPPTRREELREMFGWLNPIVHSSALYRAATARAVGGYPPDLPYAQDGGLWLRLAEQGEVGVIGELLCQQRILPQSMTRGPRYRTSSARDALTLMEYARDHLQLGAEGARRNREEVAIAALRYAAALALDGQPLDAVRLVAATIARDARGAIANRVTRAWMPSRLLSRDVAPEFLHRV